MNELRSELANTLRPVVSRVIDERTRPHMNPVVEIEEAVGDMDLKSPTEKKLIRAITNFLDRYWDSWYHEFPEVIAAVSWEEGNELLESLRRGLSDIPPTVPSRIVEHFTDA